MMVTVCSIEKSLLVMTGDRVYTEKPLLVVMMTVYTYEKPLLVMTGYEWFTE